MSALSRRALTIPGYAAGWVLCVASAPIWIPLAALVDLVRRSPGVALRSGAMTTLYFTCELFGMAASFGVWWWKLVARPDRERWVRANYALEALWGTALLVGMKHVFGLRIHVEGEQSLDGGPILLLLRHASTADTVLAAGLVTRRHGIDLRYVLKKELLWDPCLDIVGHRTPNVFVDRASDDPSEETRRVRLLAEGLGPGEGALIYPEGTRFSVDKRRRIIERLEQRGDPEAVAYARSLERVLPPRPAGTLALLDAAPHADVVICAHTGFEHTASLAAIWNGGLVHAHIRVQLRRIPRAAIPQDDAERIAWLREEWRHVDAWCRKAVEEE